MSSADAAFAIAEEMKKTTAELAKGRETVEKLTRVLEALLEPLDQMVLSVNFQKANTIPTQTGPLTPTRQDIRREQNLQREIKMETTIRTCNRCGAPLKMKDGKIDWKKGERLGIFIPMNPDGTEHRCQTGGRRNDG
jgi:hypothetical protein